VPVVRPRPRDPVPGERTGAPGGPGGVSGPLARTSPASPGETGLICRLIVLLPRGNAVKTSPGCRAAAAAAAPGAMAGVAAAVPVTPGGLPPPLVPPLSMAGGGVTFDPPG
jgi:hypothetical protein